MSDARNKQGKTAHPDLDCHSFTEAKLDQSIKKAQGSMIQLSMTKITDRQPFCLKRTLKEQYNKGMEM